MLQGGYYIGGISSGGGSEGSKDVYLDNGEIVFASVDPIYIDENGDVFFDDANKNARMYMDGTNIFVERVI